MDTAVDGSTTAALATRTLLDRLVASGITAERARSHIRGGWVRVDGRIVTEPDAPAGASVELRVIPWSESAD
ncbi:MAG: hypothetical protein NTW05_09680 [Pseudonocardiales bacterium]|nr:hypothetical protein [Pseudonocardiales bacterium]